MNIFIPAVKLFMILTMITGALYPMAVTGVAKAFFSNKASGQLIQKDGKAIGSALIAQKFENDKYFWARPSAVDFNPLPSGGSNLGPTSRDLKKQIEERRKKYQANDVPEDLLFASGSGLDPHISVAAARFQVARVARERNVPVEQIALLIEKNTEDRDLRIFGEKRVNVLELNLALDQL